MNLEELLKKYISGYIENEVSENSAGESLWKHILRDEAQTFPDLIREQPRKIMKWIICTDIMLRFVKQE